MLLGLITTLLIFCFNMPWANFLAKRLTSPGKFLTVYLLTGWVGVVLTWLLLSLFLVFDQTTFLAVGTVIYSLIGATKFKELRAVGKESDSSQVK